MESSSDPAPTSIAIPHDLNRGKTYRASIDGNCEDGKKFDQGYGALNEFDRPNDDAASDPHTRELLLQIASLTGPALLSLIIDPFMGMVDTAYVGRLGKESLAALGINAYIFTFSFYIFNFLTSVSTPLVVQARAVHDKEKEQSIVSQLLSVAIFLGFSLTIILFTLGKDILPIMGSQSDTIQQALGFLQIRCIAAPAVLLMNVGNGILRGNMDTRTPLYIVLAANVVNFSLDPILIFVLGFGVSGAAATTTIAEWLAAITFLICLKRQYGYSVRPSLGSFLSFFCNNTVGLSSFAVFFRTVCLQAFLTVGSAVAAHFGTAQIAAHQVAFQLWILMSFCLDALAVAASALVADAEARQKFRLSRKISCILLFMGLSVGILAGTAFLLLGGARIGALFTTDSEVKAAVQPLTSILGYTQPINSLVFVSDGILQGKQKFGYQAAVMIVAVAFSGGVLLRYSSYGLIAVWISISILQILRASGFMIDFVFFTHHENSM